jgi:competence protein ComEC
VTLAPAARRTSALAASLLGFVLGAALQLQQAALWPVSAYAAPALVSSAWLVLALWGTRLALRPVTVLGAALALSFSLTGWRACAYAGGTLDASLESRDLSVTGIVAAMPHRNEAGLRFRFEVESARLGEREVALPPDILLGWYGGVDAMSEASVQRTPVDLRAGDRWQWNVRLKAPHGHVNPHGFDYELWLWEQGLQATGYVRAGPRDPPPRRIGSTWRHPLEQARQHVRDAIFARVPDARLAGVIAALVVGDQGAIERADWDVFRATGVAHLMSISGLHVTMFAWAAAAVVGTLWRRSALLCLAWPAQHAGVVGGVALAAGYAAFSGWGVPAQRTVLMLSVVGLLKLGAREWPWPHVWLLACAAVVLADPWALTQPGFWLSFVAVGVLFASGAGRSRLAAQPAGALHRAAAALQRLLREQWVVTVALTPLSLLLFGQVSVVGLLANLLAIPWVTLVVTPLGLAGVLWPPAWSIAALAVEALGVVLAGLASVPHATWAAPSPPAWAAALGVAGGLLLAMRLPPAVRLLGVPLLLPVLLWQAARPPPGEFELLAADVGQGNAVLVRTAAHTLLYDAGPGYSRETDAGQRVLVPLLRAGGDRVDTLVLSHRDTDHTGGAAAVLRMQPQARLVSSLEEGHPLLALAASERCAAGQSWDWDGVRFEVLHPPAGEADSRLKPNAVSCVLAIGNGRARVLLAGDIERPQELALAQKEVASLRADVLLVPHHGSKTSSSDAFLDAVRPGLALVQAGYRNRFGHPATEVVERYIARGIAVVASATCGAASWSSRAPRQVRCERRHAPRYWHHQAAPADSAGA